MLTESCIVSTLNPEKPSNSTVTGIHVQDFQPIPALKSTFKKSSTNANCLAFSPSHIFAAQADKAVINVYSRERHNQEAVVPFPEKIHSILLAGESDGAGTLVLGTEGGRVILWELGTGRQVSTPQHHLQPTTCLAVDPTSNFLLSGSSDSTIHVWSIPGLLSFSAANSNSQDLPFAPLRSLSNHRAAITAVIFGHSFCNNNIAVSASNDNSCIVWDYYTGDALRTFLLPSSPLCLALDPADRAVYTGYEDGSVQLLNFYEQMGLTQNLHESTSQSTPVQPPLASRWQSPGQADSAALCLQLSYDGTSLLSSHQNGKIHSWDVAKGMYGTQLADFAAPITNLLMLRPSGFPDPPKPNLKLHSVVKPRYESFAHGHSDAGAAIPSNYTFTAQYMSKLPLPSSTHSIIFHQALTHPSFPATLLDESLEDFLASQDPTIKASGSSELADLRAQNAALSSQLNTAQKGQRAAVTQLEEQKKEEWRRRKDEEIKAARKKRRRLKRMKAGEIARKRVMGESVDADQEMDVDEDDEELSSSTNELTDSN